MKNACKHYFDYKSLSTDAQVNIVKATLSDKFSITELTLQQTMELRAGIISGLSPMDIVSEQLVYILAINLLQEQGHATEYQYYTQFSIQAIQIISDYIINNHVEKDKGSEDIMALLNLSNIYISIVDRCAFAREILAVRNSRFQEILINIDPQLAKQSL